MSRYGRQGMAWLDEAWRGVARQARRVMERWGPLRYGNVRQARLGKVWFGDVS